MNIFVTGTDFSVGKTFISGGIAAVMQSLGYDMGIYKPVQTGCKFANNKQFSPDLNFVKKIDPNIKTYSTYNFKSKLIPPIAAENESIRINFNMIARGFSEIKEENDIVITEGTGGILCPLYGKNYVVDLISFMKMPLVIVGKADYNSINHLMLTVKIAQDYGIDILGVILNKYEADSDLPEVRAFPRYIKENLGVELLGIMPMIKFQDKKLIPETIMMEVIKNINLQAVFDMQIPKL